MAKKATRPWRYVLLKVVDRISDRNLNPTLLYFIERIFPENYIKKDVIEEIKDYKIIWKETHNNVEFYFNYLISRIDISKRRKNVWDIHFLHLDRKESNRGIKISGISHSYPSIYANEAIAHAFGLKYWENREDLYPTAGIISDLFTNIESKWNSKKEDLIEIKKLEIDDYVETELERQFEPPIKAYRGDKNFIFISYAHKDKSIAYPQIEWLNKEGYNIWYDEGIPPTTKWEYILPRKIYDSDLFIVFISNNAVASENVKREISYAIKHKSGNVLPIYIEKTELSMDLEFNLQRIQAIMKYQISENNFRSKLLETLKNKL